MTAPSRLARRTALRPEPETAANLLFIRKGTALTLGVSLGLLATWAAVATWAVLNSDLLAAHFIARENARQLDYEQRIAALRASLDRLASQRLVEQSGLHARVSELAARQAQLEERHSLIANLVGQSGTGAASGADASLKPLASLTEGTSLADAQPGSRAKPTPLPETFELRRDSPGGPPPDGRSAPRRESMRAPESQIAALESSLRASETAQLQLVQRVLRRSQAQVEALQRAIAEVGVEVDPAGAMPAKSGVGGPFVPLTAEGAADPFKALLDAAQTSLLTLDRLRRTTAALPLAQPTAGEPELTSGYGMRIDPFTRMPAMHTGIDFRAEPGAVVRAAGPGRVTTAEYAGGYGNMVEIDHGNGVTTRYAHLSSIGVTLGQSVAAGTPIGRVGSTGRSTGAHLHYETRIEGAAVDPQRFLRAGARLAQARLQSTSSTAAVPP